MMGNEFESHPDRQKKPSDLLPLIASHSFEKNYLVILKSENRKRVRKGSSRRIYYDLEQDAYTHPVTKLVMAPSFFTTCDT